MIITVVWISHLSSSPFLLTCVLYDWVKIRSPANGAAYESTLTLYRRAYKNNRRIIKNEVQIISLHSQVWSFFAAVDWFPFFSRIYP